jgi:orotidine-5'-phosphate decarboxylase
MSSHGIKDRERLIVALDVPSGRQARDLVETLGKSVTFYKVGLELFLSGDAFELLDWLAEQDKKIFVDLKFFDVPATVARAVNQLHGRNVTFATVHGNDEMMKAAAEASNDVGILAVTVLTSLDRGDLDDLGFQCDISELVCSRTRRAIESGCVGVVASGQETAMLRQNLGGFFLIVTPGIRPVIGDDDQKRTVTASRALHDGADYIVVGRPIRDAVDPRAAAESLQIEIATGLAR